MPLPRSRSFLPLDVPGGIFTSALPSIVATVAIVPRIARSNAILTSDATSWSPSTRHAGAPPPPPTPPPGAALDVLELGFLGGAPALPAARAGVLEVEVLD